AIIFNFLLWWYLVENFTFSVANEKALEFFTGYLIEKSSKYLPLGQKRITVPVSLFFVTPVSFNSHNLSPLAKVI
ncbi:hypothetical protein MXD98_16705, partial [Legionella pneumophila]|nr:hypothetical protein [Legionella pneumophila]